MKWETYILEELAEVIAGQSPPSSTYNQDGIGLPFFQGKAEFGALHPKVEKWCSEPKKIAEKGDILISVRAPVGPTNVADVKCCIGRGLSAIRPKALMNSKYLLYYLRFYEPRFQSSERGSTFQAITQSDLKSVPIPLPPKNEQKRIATILDKADALRCRREQTLSRLDELMQSVFLYMFGDPVINSRNWTQKAFGDVIENEDSKRVPVKLSDRKKMQGEFPYYGASGIIDYVDDYLFEGESLLIAEDGANLISRTTPIAFIADGRYWVNNHAHVLRFSGDADLIYLEYFFKFIDLSPYLTGSAQPKLNQKNLNRIKVLIPPIDLQLEFREMINFLHLQKKKMDSSKNLLSHLFSSLQQAAFSGQL